MFKLLNIYCIFIFLRLSLRCSISIRCSNTSWSVLAICSGACGSVAVGAGSLPQPEIPRHPASKHAKKATRIFNSVSWLVKPLSDRSCVEFDQYGNLNVRVVDEVMSPLNVVDEVTSQTDSSTKWISFLGRPLGQRDYNSWIAFSKRRIWRRTASKSG